jgi:hypothetical protein
MREDFLTNTLEQLKLAAQASIDVMVERQPRWDKCSVSLPTPVEAVLLVAATNDACTRAG